MKAFVTLAGGKLRIEVEGATQKALMKELASVQEVFNEAACGCCKSTDIRFQVREVDANSYYEMKCDKCLAILEFGQSKDTKTLYPKRKKDKDGEKVFDTEHRGWAKYVPTKVQSPAPPRKK